jgi:hypothetical protein
MPACIPGSNPASPKSRVNCHSLAGLTHWIILHSRLVVDKRNKYIKSSFKLTKNKKEATNCSGNCGVLFIETILSGFEITEITLLNCPRLLMFSES